MINGWKTKVCFRTNDNYCDADSIEVDLPAIPKRGDIIWLTATLEDKLVDQILANRHEMDYYPQAMFYGTWTDERYKEFKALSMEKKKYHMQFGDFIYVSQVFYDTNVNEVLIVLTEDLEKEV